MGARRADGGVKRAAALAQAQRRKRATPQRNTSNRGTVQSCSTTTLTPAPHPSSSAAVSNRVTPAALAPSGRHLRSSHLRPPLLLLSSSSHPLPLHASSSSRLQCGVRAVAAAEADACTARTHRRIRHHATADASALARLLEWSVRKEWISHGFDDRCYFIFFLCILSCPCILLSAAAAVLAQSAPVDGPLFRCRRALLGRIRQAHWPNSIRVVHLSDRADHARVLYRCAAAAVGAHLPRRQRRAAGSLHLSSLHLVP